MKVNQLLLLFCVANLLLGAQVSVGKHWTMEVGASSRTAFSQSGSLNVRYISPRFKWSDYELSEEEEKTAEKFKNSRIMLELIYIPPLKVLGNSVNLQSRLINTKRFSLEVYGGLKLFFIPGADFAGANPLKSRSDAWYLNMGLLCQFNLGVLLPFVDYGGDRILTLGTEVNVKALHKKPKRRYNLQMHD